MNEKEPVEISVSVRTLLESIMISGDLSSGDSTNIFISKTPDGIKIHGIYQDRGIPGYKKEFMLKESFSCKRIILTVSGKADGIYIDDEGMHHVEEIKTIQRKTDTGNKVAPLHWMQLKMYAWFYSRIERLETVTIDLVYYGRKDRTESVCSKVLKPVELEEECMPVIRRYLEWNDRLQLRKDELMPSLVAMKFPFDEFRKGQRDLSKTTYRSIRDGKHNFVQAPTGTGKTMAVIFGGLKALAEGKTSKLFFLTAKNSGSIAAENALKIINNGGVNLNWITITAKAKICFMDNKDLSGRPQCSPDLCKYSAGYYNKLPAALEEIFSNCDFDRAKIELLAQKHEVCPFEMSLDISLFCEVIIADYNYAFDYGSGLKRYFRQGKTSFSLLVDEAHNLVARARDMYSSALSKNQLMKAKRNGRGFEKSILQKLNAYFLKIKKKSVIERNGQNEFSDTIYPEGFKEQINDMFEAFSELIENGQNLSAPAYLFYREVYAMKSVLERYDETYRCLIYNFKNDFAVSLVCIDPSKQLQSILKMQKASVFFSATMQPSVYFTSLIAPGMNPEFYDLPSPFPPDNCLNVINTKLSTKWNDRERLLPEYSELLLKLLENVKGNIIVFSPSFTFQKRLVEMSNISDDKTSYDRTICIQHQSMTSVEREVFLNNFEIENNTVGFCVIGGSFSESIDLSGERLIGVVIFGTGLPQVNLYTGTIKSYFDESNKRGYDFAYTYPGINRVLQAAGRVIRDMNDRGFVLLVDDRYSSVLYKKLLPGHWRTVYENDNEKLISAISAHLLK